MKTENENSNHVSNAGDLSWLERNVNLLIVALVVACAATLAAQAYYGADLFHDHPAQFPPENVFGFEALFGFVAFIGVVFLGRLLRLFVMRKEDYYDSDDS